MQLMLNIYDFSGGARPASSAPFNVNHVRLHEPISSTRQARK